MTNQEIRKQYGKMLREWRLAQSPPLGLRELCNIVEIPFTILSRIEAGYNEEEQTKAFKNLMEGYKND